MPKNRPVKAKIWLAYYLLCTQNGPMFICHLARTVDHNMAGRSTFLTFITIPPNHELIMRRPRFIIQNAFGGEFRVKGFK